MSRFAMYFIDVLRIFDALPDEFSSCDLPANLLPYQKTAFIQRLKHKGMIEKTETLNALVVFKKLPFYCQEVTMFREKIRQLKLKEKLVKQNDKH